MEADLLSTSPVAGWGRIDVERLGGLAGYGMPGSRLRSRGHILANDLSLADQDVLRTLFVQPIEVPTWMRDGFRYHLTRQSDCGPQTVVAAETAVPEAIRECVRDEIV
ncbi:protealysin inhibitor emfourin [Pantoea sp. 18069]|uniref:protealysin inhibitor emfourin n=1 Tax=Pantoea sp. 18069 TaxID=2681415 RepID=UPI00135BA85B|nr:protealysin inhibitor emfourin [Pantoea sp. 18069]